MENEYSKTKQLVCLKEQSYLALQVQTFFVVVLIFSNEAESLAVSALPIFKI